MELSEETMQSLKEFMDKTMIHLRELAESLNSFMKLAMAGFQELEYPSKEKRFKPVLKICPNVSYIKDKRLTFYHGRGNR